MTRADYALVTRPDLWNGRNGTFYAITPVKGARISGTFYVGMTSHETSAAETGDGFNHHHRDKVDAPAMWVDLSPSIADDRGGVSPDRESLTVNGKEYRARFGARAELIPAFTDDHRAQYYPIMTVDGHRYLVTVRFDSWDGFTDSARAMLTDVIQAIALEYVTDARWHAKRVEQATYARDRAADKVRDAQETLAAKQSALDALTAIVEVTA